VTFIVLSFTSFFIGKSANFFSAERNLSGRHYITILKGFCQKMKLGLMLFDTTYGRTRINQSVSYGDGPQNEAERQWHGQRNPPKAMDCPSEISSLTATRLAYYGHNWLRHRRRGYLVEVAIATSQRR
jgi:hypothetical protein